MNAMILAAGRGERMRPLTNHCPKPMLTAGGRTLLDWHLLRLQKAGFSRVVINIAWLGQRIREHLAHSTPNNLEIVLCDEGEHALETAGGIINALPLLGEAPFAVINGDIWTDFDLASLPRQPEGLAHLVLVDNPAHHPRGDFGLQGDTVVNNDAAHSRLTFAGVGCYHPALFAGQSEGVAPLAPILRRAIDRRQVTGEHYRGRWYDIGTPTRLAALDTELRAAT